MTVHRAFTHHSPDGLRVWWMSPPRSGMRLIISPIEYRHLRGLAGVRVVSGTILVGLSAATVIFGGNDAKTYGWALAFLATAAANLAFAYWDLRIARSSEARS